MCPYEPEDIANYTYEYRVFPGIGIARMGNSETQCFVGPEVPTQRFIPKRIDINTLAPITDSENGKGYREVGSPWEIAKQAARFRLFRFKFPLGRVATSSIRPISIDEITSETHDLEWAVQVANAKSYTGSASTDFPPTNDKGEFIDPTDMNTTSFRFEIDEVLLRNKRAQNGDGMVSARIPLVPPTVGPQFHLDDLGSMIVDKNGQLLVIGSSGKNHTTNASPASRLYLFNSNYFDDASDGYVAVRYKDKNAQDTPANWNKAEENSWVVNGPPNFSNDIEPVTSLYDYAYSLFTLGGHSSFLGGNSKKPRVSFMGDIFPLFRRIADQAEVQDRNYYPHTTLFPTALNADGSSIFDTLGKLSNDPATQNANLATRKSKFDKLRLPNVVADYYNIREARRSPINNMVDTSKMPKFLGVDAYKTVGSNVHGDMALTAHQYAGMYLWKNGDFEDEWPGQYPKLDETENTPLTRRPGDYKGGNSAPGDLDRAHMGRMNGGPFLPGIEVGSAVTRKKAWRSIYGVNTHGKDTLYLRVNSYFCSAQGDVEVFPGDLTHALAIPWQGDFYACNTQFWPASRPGKLPSKAVGAAGAGWAADGGVTSTLEMAASWHKLGFICRKTTTSTTQHIGLEQRYSYKQKKGP